MQKIIENVKSNIDVVRELKKIEELQLSSREIEELLSDGETVRNETRETIYIYVDRKNKELYIEKFNW